MSDPENPLARWLRRKSDASAGERDVGAAPHARDAVDGDAGASGPANSSNDIPAPFDPERLPALESIDAKTDLRAFLDQNVPADLTVAALRRGWSTDPAIRDFIGLSENSWDFNAPDGIPGFGSLTPENVARLLAQMLEEPEIMEETTAASTGSSGLGQSALPVTEHAESPNAPQDESVRGSADDFSLRRDQDALMRGADSAPGVSAAALDAVGAQPAQDQNIDRPSHQRRHGGALPHFIDGGRN